MRRAAFLAPLACLALAASLAAGCEDRPVHIFSGERYDPVGDCLEKAAALDVIDGADPGPCDVVRCWAAPAGDVYITTSACDAPLDLADRTGDPPGSPCAKALDAFAKKARCAP